MRAKCTYGISNGLSGQTRSDLFAYDPFMGFPVSMG